MTKSEHSKLHILERIEAGKNYDISNESKRGENHNNAKLNDYQVSDILNDKRKNKEIALSYNVSISCIKHIKNKRTWKHI